MASLHMFNDIPSIDVEDGPFHKNQAYHANGADVEPFWAPVDTAYLSTVPFYGPERSLQQDVWHAPPYPQQLPASLDVSDAAIWPSDSKTLKSHFIGCWESGRLQDYRHRWSQPCTKARYNSPDGSMGGDRSATELDSSTGGSVWSPKRSVDLREPSYFESIEGLDTHCFSGSQSQDHGSAPLHLGCSSLHSYPSPPGPGFGDGVALRDVQEFPDGEIEGPMEQYEYEERNMEQQSSYLGLARPHECLPEGLHARRNYDEGIGSSIHDESPSPSMKAHDDIGMVDEVKEEDEDDVSDYRPLARSKRNSHNRKGSMTKSPSSPTKRSSRSKRSSKLAPTNKVSKRRTKSTPIHPITPISPLQPRSTNPAAISTHGNTTSHTCPNCHEPFPTPSAMHKHNLTAHTRPFTCTFGPYGCPARFGSKNEWKRHVSSQHIQLGIWRCDQGTCIPQPISHRHSLSSTSKRRGAKGSERDDIIVVGGPTVDPSDAGFNEFNRKDLFTQHLRRMHSPARSAPAADLEAFEASLEDTRRRCWIKTREAPPASVCGYCCDGDGDMGGLKHEGVFEGTDSWDERMEHVGRHLERGHAGREWREDVGLREWMVREGLVVWEGKARRWVLGGIS